MKLLLNMKSPVQKITPMSSKHLSQENVTPVMVPVSVKVAVRFLKNRITKATAAMNGEMKLGWAWSCVMIALAEVINRNTGILAAGSQQEIVM